MGIGGILIAAFYCLFSLHFYLYGYNLLLKATLTAFLKVEKLDKI